MEYQHQRVPGHSNNNNNNHDEKELKMKMNDPALMSVMEKRARLAKFGQQNRDHFENGNKFNTRPKPPQVRQRVDHIERIIVPTSRDGNNDDSNHCSLSPPPPERRSPASSLPLGATAATAVVKPQRAVWRSESWRSERLPSKRDSPENPPVVIRRASQDFIPQRQYSSAAAASRPGPFLRAFTDVGQDKDKKQKVVLTFSPVPTTPPATTATTMAFMPRQSPFKDKDLVATSSNEDERHFRIVHAQSLLVPPKPHAHRHYRRSLPDHLFWEAEFDSDDFSDPFYSSSSATNASSAGSSASSTLWHPRYHPHAVAAAAARHRRRHSMDSIDDCWNNAANSGSWSVDDGIMSGMHNNNSNNNNIYASSTNTGRYTEPDPRRIHRRPGQACQGGAGVGHARRFTNHHQQQHYYGEEVSPFNHVNSVNNNKSTGGGIRHKFPLLLCKSNKTGDDDDVRPNPTVMTTPIPPFTNKGHALVHPKHVMAPRLQRSHSNRTMSSAATTRNTVAEFDDYSTHDNRRKSHVQLHLPARNGVGYCHSLETDEVNGVHINNDTPVAAMHNATILQDRMLTSSTLELLCGNGAARVDDPIKHYNGRGGGGGYGEEGTVSTWDELSNSCGPSPTSAIVPGAVASKLGDVFAEEAAAAAVLATVTTTNISNKKRNGIVRGQEMLTTTTAKELQRVQSFPMRGASVYDNKNGTVHGVQVTHVASIFNEQEPNGGSSFAKARARISSLQQQATPGSEAATTTTTTTTTASSTATSIDSSTPPFRSSRSSSSSASSYSSGIRANGQKFGAPKKHVSAVQLSKEKLQKKWNMDRAPTHVKKTNWYVDKKSGTYRKKVAINFSKPEDFY